MSSEFPRANLPSTAVDPDSLARHEFSADPHPGVYVPQKNNNLGSKYICVYRSFLEFRVMPTVIGGIYNPTFVWYTGENTNDPVTGVMYYKLHPYVYKGSTVTIGAETYPVWEDQYQYIATGAAAIDEAINKHVNDQDPRYPYPHPTLARAVHSHAVNDVTGVDNKIVEVTSGLYARICNNVSVIPTLAGEGALIIFTGVTTTDFVKGHMYLYTSNAWVDVSPTATPPGNGMLTVTVNGETKATFSANQAVNAQLDLVIPNITVDDTLSTTSTNPVQNKVITTAMENSYLSPYHVSFFEHDATLVPGKLNFIYCAGVERGSSSTISGTKIRINNAYINLSSHTKYHLNVSLDDIHDSQGPTPQITFGDNIYCASTFTPGLIHNCELDMIGNSGFLTIKGTARYKRAYTHSGSEYVGTCCGALGVGSDLFIKDGKLYRGAWESTGMQGRGYRYKYTLIDGTIDEDGHGVWQRVIGKATTSETALAVNGTSTRTISIVDGETVITSIADAFDGLSSGLFTDCTAYGIKQNQLYSITRTGATMITDTMTFKDVEGFTSADHPDMYAYAIGSDDNLYSISSTGILARVLTGVKKVQGPAYKNHIYGCAISSENKLYLLTGDPSAPALEVSNTLISNNIVDISGVSAYDVTGIPSEWRFAKSSAKESIIVATSSALVNVIDGSTSTEILSRETGGSLVCTKLAGALGCYSGLAIKDDTTLICIGYTPVTLAPIACTVSSLTGWTDVYSGGGEMWLTGTSLDVTYDIRHPSVLGTAIRYSQNTNNILYAIYPRSVHALTWLPLES